MSVKITGVEKDSVAEDYGFEPGDSIVAIDGNDIMDVLDYRFYQNNDTLDITVLTKSGETVTVTVEKEEYEDLGLQFETYLMDKKRSCKNKCIFCFIDQMPKGLRESLYFKDDDSRLSFLFGNYITLTNITEHEIERIIRLHISPINISVHTTNPELRVKMMKNRFAGDALKIMYRLNDAGIKLNGQLVLCPGYNDGEELEKSLKDLCELENMQSVSAVPVGITKYREGLEHVDPFDKQSAARVIDTIEKYGEICLKKYGQRRVYASDEFYITAGRKIPPVEFYEDFPQIENGVGMWSMMRDSALKRLDEIKEFEIKDRKVSIVTGMASLKLIDELSKKCEEKCHGLNVKVFGIKNIFFGERITVAGLITATDIIDQLKGKDLGSELLIPSAMLRSERDLFLDDISISELSKALGVKVSVSECNGIDFVNALLQKE